MTEKIKLMTTAALFTALTAVTAQISIPMPGGVPLTFQSFAVALCGFTLGIQWGSSSIAAYILLGLTGIPVFSGFTGGIGRIFGATGGFIYGFIPFVLLCGLTLRIKPKLIKIASALAGLVICHLLGTLHFTLVYGSGFIASAATVSFPYLLKDVISVLLAYPVSVRLIPFIKRL